MDPIVGPRRQEGAASSGRSVAICTALAAKCVVVGALLRLRPIPCKCAHVCVSVCHHRRITTATAPLESI